MLRWCAVSCPKRPSTDEAKACFDKLLVKGGNYVVVLNPDQTIAGIVTRSSMARALASAVLGGLIYDKILYLALHLL